MAFKTFAPGVLTSSDVNTFLMRQSVIACTSATRPASPSEGMTIYETDTDAYLTYSGTAWENAVTVGAWDTYAGTLISTGAGTDWVLGNGTLTTKHCKVGRLTAVSFSLVMGSTTTFGTKFLGISLPFPTSIGSEDLGAGVAWAKDVSAGNTVHCELGVLSNYVSISAANHSTGIFVLFDAIDSTTPFTWATSDRVEGQAIYEANV
jgi:hypothetical protein